MLEWGAAFKERPELSREGCVMWGRKEWYSLGGSGTCRSLERGKEGERGKQVGLELRCQPGGEGRLQGHGERGSEPWKPMGILRMPEVSDWSKKLQKWE